jgi:translation elongation factor EF-1beta
MAAVNQPGHGEGEERQLLALHTRLRQGDPDAFVEIADRLYLPLQVRVALRFRGQVDEQILADGVTRALMGYRDQPQEFDPGGGGRLDTFLAWAAWQNVRDLLKAETRRKDREKKVAQEKSEIGVGLDPLAAYISVEDEEEKKRRLAWLESRLSSMTDKQLFVAMAAGRASTAACAVILSITHLPPKDQEVRANRAKDRIMHFLRREVKRRKGKID